MKKVISMLYVIIFCFCLTACDNSGMNESSQTNQNEVPRSDSTKPIDDVEESKTLTTIDLLITVGEKTFSGKLYDNQTTQALVEKFPLTVDMSELNGNIKVTFNLAKYKKLKENKENQ